MSNIAATLKATLKEESPELLEKLISNNVSDEEIERNQGVIYKYLENNDQEDYIIDIVVVDGKIQINFIPQSEEAKELDKINEVKKNYLAYDFDDEMFLLDLNDNLIKDKRRQEIFAKIKTIIDDFESGKNTKGYFLWGDYGIGKTWITIALLNKFAKDGYKVSYTSWTTLFRRIKNNFGEDDASSEKLIKMLIDSDVLYIDDVSGERVSEWSREEIMFPILNRRMAKGKLTFFTSNLSLDQYTATLFTRKDDSEKVAVGRIVERISALMDEIHLEGANYRMEGGK